MKKELFGEFLGTFILVFIGCGSVIAAVVLDWLTSLEQVAIVWGIGVASAIYASWKLSPAHLNPSVTIALAISKQFQFRRVFPFVLMQFFGAFVAASFLYLMFSGSISDYEVLNKIVRDGSNGYLSAQVYGEFFPNPGFPNIQISWTKAMLLEALGTFFLMLMIYLTNKVKLPKLLIPLVIGATISFLIIAIAPYTQAGFNPARDFGPRLFAYFAGWGNSAFPKVSISFFTVYILGPILGASLAGVFYRLISLSLRRLRG